MYIDVAFSLPVKKLFTYQIASSEACKIGSRVTAYFSGRKLTGLVVSFRDTAPSGVQVREVLKILDRDPVLQDEHFLLARWMEKVYFSSLGECLHTMAPPGRKEAEYVLQNPQYINNVVLNDEQQEIVQKVLHSHTLMHYVYGITGSGKTEVFLNIAEHIIKQGKSVIYLVPEITLSYQLIEQVALRFGSKSAILHSRLSANQRFGQWKAIQRGEKKIVVGTRSAVFAPVKSLGMLVIDEEQDTSYKSGKSPRYHARHIAAQRCRYNQALLIMGSATPSIEMWHQMQSKNLIRHSLRKRVGGAQLPKFDLIDMNKEEGILSQSLLSHILQTHRSGKQSILFINRRGFARVLRCVHCGFVMECVRCSVFLIYHRTSQKMLCHYCGYTTKPLQECPECKSVQMEFMSFGSQKVEEHLQQIFPQVRIARLDSDVVRKKGMGEKILTAFSKGEFDILLGTQMIAKGLNFKRVKLVGIVLADTELAVPDFRSLERTFSQIVQVAGRAGRFSSDGMVIIQSYRLWNTAIQKAVRYDIESFFDQELIIRKKLNFPPYSRIIRILIRGKDKEIVRETIESLARYMHNKRCKTIEILGPSFCLLSRISGNYRMHILFLSYDFRKIRVAVADMLSMVKIPYAVYCEVDVDPVTML